jgi:chromate transporter
MPAEPAVRFPDAVRTWLKIGLLGFGGPAGQIALMERELVDRRRWIGPERFRHALSYCMLLPGPEAQQLATYIGWLLHRTPGGLVAGSLFVLPGALVVLALSALYVTYGTVAWVAAMFAGLKPAVIAIVVDALLRIGKRGLTGAGSAAIAAAAYVAIAFYAVPFPLIVLLAGVAGFAVHRGRAAVSPARATPGAPPPAAAPATRGAPDARGAPPRSAPAAHAYTLADDALAGHARPTLGRTLRVAAVWLALWWLPVALMAPVLGGGHVLVREAVFFGQVAVVSFGGAYAALAYVAQQAVSSFGWLASGEMLDGLGLAETTPGPLVLVTQFVGFLGAFRHPEPFTPLVAGVLGSFVVTWAVFMPSFLWIFVGAPYIERLREHKSLSAALSGVTAAVTGVIFDLSLWFALHALFGRLGEARIAGARLLLPEWSTLDLYGLAIAIAAFVALRRLRWGMPRVVGGAALAGLARLAWGG